MPKVFRLPLNKQIAAQTAFNRFVFLERPYRLFDVKSTPRVSFAQDSAYPFLLFLLNF